MDHVAGYCVCNDVSEREYQIERGGTWDKGKGCDTFGPTGPWMVTRDEVPDPQNLALWTEVDGERMQDGTTADHDLRRAASWSATSATSSPCMPGDIIATGTPPGVGMGKKPEPIFLRARPSDAPAVEGLGEQTQRVVEA